MSEQIQKQLELVNPPTQRWAPLFIRIISWRWALCIILYQAWHTDSPPQKAHHAWRDWKSTEKCEKDFVTPENKHGTRKWLPKQEEIPALETIIFRFHVKFWGCIIVFQIQKKVDFPPIATLVLHPRNLTWIPTNCHVSNKITFSKAHHFGYPAVGSRNCRSCGDHFDIIAGPLSSKATIFPPSPMLGSYSYDP